MHADLKVETERMKVMQTVAKHETVVIFKLASVKLASFHFFLQTDRHYTSYGRLPLPHSQASSLFIGSDSSASDTDQMTLWNRLPPRTVGPGRRGPVSVQLTLALAEFLLVR